ncbi:hypothetical protein JVU11DRAFT_7800 [Chiua virens]|nr:hypothetical protein JVU11DRAFT_7800 [Chiua virens]
MNPPAYPEPSTESSVADARRALQVQRRELSQLSDRISSAEEALTQLVTDRKRAIREMQCEQYALEEKVKHTLAYISPIRRLPHELLRHIFMFNFDNHPCCAWILASVCVYGVDWLYQYLNYGPSYPVYHAPFRFWKRYVGPHLLRVLSSFAQIRFELPHLTSDLACPDTTQRSGDKVPLDIEIYLRVNGSSVEPSSRARASSPTPWIPPPPSPPTHYILPHPPPGTAILIPPAQTPIIVPQSPSHHDTWGATTPPPPSRSCPQVQRNTHWGHIAIFYLIEQMHRWERFVFRFDKQFPSISALKSINGDAPLLREFEISCAESIYASEWAWLPCASPLIPLTLSQLQSLMLHHVPFKWSSPIFKTDLRSLNLRSLPSNHLPLDRILHIISSNPNLEALTLHFSVVVPAILPLVTTSLPKLRELTFGGHYHMSTLADALVLPALDVLNLDIEARDPIEDVITNLLQRSNNPPITQLSVSYGSSNTSTLYYGPGGIVIAWNFLAEMNHVHSLSVGGTPLEPLLVALGMPEEEQSHWTCPNLKSVTMKSCHTHPDGIAKLVQLIEARNPETGTAVMVHGVTPSKLRHIELHDCASVGQDVLEWLNKRVEEVICVEPPYGRSL